MAKSASFLQKLAQKEPAYINTEYVYPCKIKDAVYIDPLCEENSHLFSFVKTHLKTIVTPHGYKALSKKTAAEQIDVLQSLYENGRVLESKDTITLYGKKYVMSMKGIGSTNFCRTTSAINPFLENVGYKQDELEKKLLEVFPYVDCSGLLPLQSALIEKDNSLRLESLGIDVERILAIHTLSEVMGPKGKYIPISQLEQDGIIREKKDPCIISRLHKTNIRMLDLYMMKDYGKKSLIKPAIKEILRVAKMHWGVENINEYLKIFVQRALHNRLVLSQYCNTINGKRWNDIARNMTCLAEEVDLVTIEKYSNTPRNPHDFGDNYRRQVEYLMNGIRIFISIIEKEGGYEVDHQLIADTIRETIKTYLLDEKKEELRALFMKENWYKWYSKDDNEQSFISFYNVFARKVFSFILEYNSHIGYAKILKQRLKPLEE